MVKKNQCPCKLRELLFLVWKTKWHFLFFFLFLTGLSGDEHKRKAVVADRVSFFTLFFSQ